MSECIYCGYDTEQTDPPALGDNEGWDKVATEHADHCEWILTRAFRRDVPAKHLGSEINLTADE